MKLVTYERKAGPVASTRLGLLIGDLVADLRTCTLQRLSGGLDNGRAREEVDNLAPADMLTFLKRGEEALAAARETLEFARTFAEGAARPDLSIWPVADVKLRAPLRRPNSIRDFITFEEHIKTAYGKLGLSVNPIWYELPVYYKGNPDSVIGPEDDVIWPSFTRRLDYELELGMIIGRQGADISKDAASRHIAGYTIFNDMSARDIQGKEMSLQLGPAKSKDFDTGNILGPCLVTPDEFDPRNARMQARINDEVWSDGNARGMHYTFEDLIAHVSMSETIYPGDLFGSGTVGGGCGVELGKWLQPDDIVELEIEGIGVLRNRVIRRNVPS